MPATAAKSAKERVPVIGARPGATVELVPGQRFAVIEQRDVPKVAMAELVPAGDGTFRLVARVLPRRCLNTAKNLRQLGIVISHDTMKRLINTGFIKGHQETPGLYLFDYDSYLAHAAQCEAGSFWTPERRRQYSTYIAY